MKIILLILTVGCLLLAVPQAQAAPWHPEDDPEVGCSGPESPGGHLTPEQLAELGRTDWERYIDEYGVVTNRPDWNETVRRVVDRVTRASGHPGLDITWAILDYPELNAWVTAGDYMMVYSGLLEFFEDLATQRHPQDRARQREAFEILVAGVLGHEVAHLTLGHPGTLVARHLASEDTPAGYSEGEGVIPEHLVELMADRAYGRACETDADKTGALYLVRAGYEIQGMIDFFREMNNLIDRDSDYVYFSYLNSHPHPAEREADLEIYRGELKRHQRRFDDALTLVRNNVELSHALELLDQVLDDFPDLLAARHLRATALHRQWLNDVPVQQQRLRPNLLTVPVNFVPGIRGGSPPAAQLIAAGVEYDRILADRTLPQTVSNRSLVHAYLGENAAAERLARRAADLERGDIGLQNNLATVLFLTGKHDEALQILRSLVGNQLTADNIIAAFNLGLALAELDDPAAVPYLRAVVDNDQGSAWTQYAEERLLQLGEEAAAKPAASASRRAPALVDIELGEQYTSVYSKLGEPEDSDGDVWDYPSRGVTIGFDQSGDVIILAAYAPEVGTIDGIRVGAQKSAVGSAWGLPDQRLEDEWGEIWWYVFGDWALTAEFDGEVLDGIGIISR